MRIVTLLAALAAAACAPIVPPAGPATPLHEVSSPVPADSEAACATQGGAWRPICLLGKPACVLTYADAGMPCTDGAQCAGNCIAPGPLAPDKPAQGVCTTTSDPCGCKQFVENGKAGYPLCID
jgi:hypothetical protein